MAAMCNVRVSLKSPTPKQQSARERERNAPDRRKFARSSVKCSEHLAGVAGGAQGRFTFLILIPIGLQECAESSPFERMK